MSPSHENSMLAALTCQGVLIQVSVRYWRARQQLLPADLGLTTGQVDPRLISLGHKRLLPPVALAELARLEGRAHALVEENTFPFLNGVGRFLPNRKLSVVTAGLEALNAEFAQAQARFLTHFPHWRAEALRDWEVTLAALEANKEVVLARLAAAYPAPAKLLRHFDFAVSLYQVQTPDVPQAQLIELGTQQALIAAREEVAATAKRELEVGCRDFIADCVATLREQTAKLADEMLGTIRGTGNVHQKTLNRLLKFLEHFRELNFVGDVELDRHLAQVREELLLQPAAAYRDSETARRRLVAGLEQLRSTAHELAQADAQPLVAQFGQLGRRKFSLAA